MAISDTTSTLLVQVTQRLQKNSGTVYFGRTPKNNMPEAGAPHFQLHHSGFNSVELHQCQPAAVRARAFRRNELRPAARTEAEVLRLAARAFCDAAPPL